jgi:hypothetical protein
MKKLMEYREHEYLKYSTVITDDELMEMANISPNKTGIKDVFIWVGPNPNSHWKRIKVSNVQNKFDKNDCFTITIPDFKVIGEPNSKLITKNILEDIIKFIQLNMQLILDYSDEKISTDELIDNIQKIT